MTTAITSFWLNGWGSGPASPTPGATLPGKGPTVLTATGNATIIRGDSYYLSDGPGRALIWAVTAVPSTYDFSGAVTTFSARNISSLLTKTNSTTPGVTASFLNGTLTLTVELSASDTTGLNVADYNFDIQTAFSNGHVETWVKGIMTVQADVR